MTAILEQNKVSLANLCKKYHVASLDVFGSAATNEFNELTSDIDFMVVFDESVNPNRFDTFFALQEELKKLFGRPVDLVEPGGLRNPYFIESIEQTRRRVYAAS
jgi:uncharacterized protein